MDSDGVYDFLRATAAVLSQSGVPVLVPTWWARPGTRLRLTASARTPPQTDTGAVGPGAYSLVEVTVAIALGDEALSEAELDPARFAALLAARRDGIDCPLRWPTARLASGVERLADGLAMDEAATEGELGRLLTGLREPRRLASLATPAMFEAELRPCQERGYAWPPVLERLVGTVAATSRTGRDAGQERARNLGQELVAAAVPHRADRP